mgnify:CR=1 FL=1
MCVSRADSIFDNTLTLSAASLPAIDPAVINLPTDPVPLGLRTGQTLMTNSSGVVGNNFDSNALLTLTLLAPGDYNLDGHVDGGDFLAWQYGISPNPLSASDLATWQGSYRSDSSVLMALGTTVPEPNSMLLLLAALGTIVPSCWIRKW